MDNRKKGFTLVEMLCTIIIMLLVSLCVSLGIKLAVDHYSKSKMDSAAQLLCATVSDIVCDELRFCANPTLDSEDGTITFTSSYGIPGQSFWVTDSGEVMLGNEKILPSKAYIYGLRAHLTFENLSEPQMLRVKVEVRNPQNTQLLAERAIDVELLKKVTTDTD